MQTFACDALIKNKHFLLAGGIGTGKTAITLDAIKTLSKTKDEHVLNKDDKGNPNHVLVVAQKCCNQHLGKRNKEMG